MRVRAGGREECVFVERDFMTYSVIVVALVKKAARACECVMKAFACVRVWTERVENPQ